MTQFRNLTEQEWQTALVESCHTYSQAMEYTRRTTGIGAETFYEMADSFDFSESAQLVLTAMTSASVYAKYGPQQSHCPAVGEIHDAIKIFLKEVNHVTSDQDKMLRVLKFLIDNQGKSDENPLEKALQGLSSKIH